MTVLLIAGHGKNRNGSFDPGATGLISKGEHRYVTEDLFPAMKRHLPKNADVVFHTAYNVYDYGNIISLAKKHGNDTKVIEVHFDAFKGTSNGGHVIVHKKYEPDALDLRLRDAIKSMVGLRFNHKGHQGISGRDNLANVNRTANGGVNYRLIELGFGDNNPDADILINRVDEYAQKLVQAIFQDSKKDVAKPKPKPAPKPKPSAPSKPKPKTPAAKLIKNEKSKYTVTTSAGIKVRNAPSTTAKHTGTLPKGASINYDSVYEGNGYRWLSYIGGSGNRLYLPYRPLSGKNEVWGTFGSTPKPATPKAKTLHLPASAKLWKVYKPNGPYTSGNEIHNLTPSAYGGLIYDIKGNPAPHVYLIDTGVRGRVAIYAHPNTGAVIK